MFVPLLKSWLKMDYLHRVLKNTYPDWMIKESEKKLATPIINQDIGLEIKKNIFISVPFVPGLSEECRRIFWPTSVQVIFKGANPLIYILVNPKDKIPSQLKQNIIHKRSCPEENFKLSHIRESSRCLKNRVKENNSHLTSAICKQHFQQPPLANISHFNKKTKTANKLPENPSILESKTLPSTITLERYPRNLQPPSWNKQIFQWVRPNGWLRPPTRSCSSHHSKQQSIQSNLFGKLSSLYITPHSTGILPCHKFPSVGTFYFKVQIHI